MAEDIEPDPPGRPGTDPEGIAATARMAAELAGQAHPEGGAAAREALYAEVIGPNRTGHFLNRFAKYDARGGAWAFTWNWPCAFFPVLWLLYRKMYALGASLILVELVLMPVLAAAPLLSLGVTAVLMLAVPAGADWLYYRHVGKVIARSRDAAATDAERGAWRRARGGVSWVGPVILMVVSLMAALWAVQSGIPGV